MSRAWHQRFEPELAGRTPGQLVTAAAHLVPAVLALPLDRRGDGQVRGRIARALPLVAHQEARVVALVPPAEHKRMHVTLELAPHVEEAGALRRAQPLVAIARVEVGIELAEVQGQVSRDVGAVDDGDDPALAR